MTDCSSLLHFRAVFPFLCGFLLSLYSHPSKSLLYPQVGGMSFFSFNFSASEHQPRIANLICSSIARFSGWLFMGFDKWMQKEGVSLPWSTCYEDHLFGVLTAFISGCLDKHLQSEATEKAEGKQREQSSFRHVFPFRLINVRQLFLFVFVLSQFVWGSIPYI